MLLLLFLLVKDSRIELLAVEDRRERVVVEAVRTGRNDAGRKRSEERSKRKMKKEKQRTRGLLRDE